MTLHQALALAIAECNNPKKNAVNPHLKNQFADLKEVLATVKPILARHGLTVVQLIGGTAGTLTTVATSTTRPSGTGSKGELLTATESSTVTTATAGVSELRTILIHAESGEKIESVQQLKNHQPGTNEAQSSGINITYMRRYALLALLGIVGDADGDGSEYDWNAPKPSNKLLMDAEAAAQSKTLREFWKGLSQKDRDALAPEIERLKAIGAQ